MDYPNYYDLDRWAEILTKQTFPSDKNSPKKCNHEYVAIKLVFSTVYDCKLCGAKKELEEK